jgi:hypothetical protein
MGRMVEMDRGDDETLSIVTAEEQMHSQHQSVNIAQLTVPSVPSPIHSRSLHVTPSHHRPPALLPLAEALPSWPSAAVAGPTGSAQ